MTDPLNVDQFLILTFLYCILFFQGTRIEVVLGTMVYEVFTQRLASKRRTKFYNSYHVNCCCNHIIIFFSLSLDNDYTDNYMNCFD